MYHVRITRHWFGEATCKAEALHNAIHDLDICEVDSAQVFDVSEDDIERPQIIGGIPKSRE